MIKRICLFIISILVCLVIFESKNVIATDVEKSEDSANIIYQVHVQNVGWMQNKKDGEDSGTTGQSLRVEAVKIKLKNNEEDINVKYQVHVQDIGWQDWKKDGEIAGTTGKSLRIEAIKIKVDNSEEYDIQYQVHVQNIGWQDWKKNGELAGTTGKSLRIEAIRIKLIKKQAKGKIEIEIPSDGQNVYSGKNINIVGWKAANVSNTKVKAYLDDFQIDSSEIVCSSRSDLVSKIKEFGEDVDNSKPCFTYKINTENLEIGSHIIKMELCMSDDIVLSSVSKSFNIVDSKNVNLLYISNMEKYGWLQYTSSGDTSGIDGGNLKMYAIKIESKNIENTSVKYQVYMSNTGWQNWKSDGEIAGNTDNIQHIEAFRIKLENPNDYNVCYRAYVRNIGWQEWKYDGEIAGFEKSGIPIEAIQIKITNEKKVGKLYIDTLNNGQKIYGNKEINICGWKMSNKYNSSIQVFVDNIKINQGDINYVSRDDVIASVKGYGTVEQNKYPGFNFAIDSTKYSEGNHKLTINLITQSGIVISKSEINFYILKDKNMHIIYNSHMQKYGWQQYVADGEKSGKDGETLRLEGIKIELLNAPTDAKVKYRSHIQNIGWQDWKYNSELSGTEGMSFRIEAIQIKLENMDDKTVEYRVHVQDIGWTSWSIDGETAGTTGQGRRIEAIQIRLVPKYTRNSTVIDVSEFNGTINWQNVKKSGIDYAMIRVGYRGWGNKGNFKVDDKFYENIQNAKDAGIKVGIYFFTQAKNTTEAIEEANWVVDKIRYYQIDLPVAIDVEESGASALGEIGRVDNLDKYTRTYIVKAFCERIQQYGYVPMVYLNVYWAYNCVDMGVLRDYDTWIAHYTNAEKPSYRGNYTMWQYTSSGSINGINGNVDVNKLYKNY